MIVRVFGQRLLHEHHGASILSNAIFVSMVVRVFGQRFVHEHSSASNWSEALT